MDGIVKRVAIAVVLFAFLVAACGDDEPAPPVPKYDGQPISYWIDALRERSDEDGLVTDALSRAGVEAVPALMSLAIVFAFIREWRGSIVASATAHALHNGTLVTALLFALG